MATRWPLDYVFFFVSSESVFVAFANLNDRRIVHSPEMRLPNNMSSYFRLRVGQFQLADKMIDHFRRPMDSNGRTESATLEGAITNAVPHKNLMAAVVQIYED